MLMTVRCANCDLEIDCRCCGYEKYVEKEKLLAHIKEVEKECFEELRTKTIQKDISYLNGAWNIIISLKRYIENENI